MGCCSGDGEVTEVTQSSSATTSKNTEPLSMTHEAVKFVKEIMEREKKQGMGLRIDVMPGGCAGFQYYMDFQDKAEPGDKEFDFHGVKIFMSLMSFGFMKGSTIEFISSLESTGIKVNNPNVTKSCGCGKSFG